ncbi:hypothetical protein [Endozoicomonas ascidiicola]|uniref:hypothetical protein n=1 Tax=Endozoicomonas ascidiicola TaxID=1698521 RepID=UPI0008304405|nr:hypothetical protein [Endozoicomonas ascidiicola]
MKKWAIRGFAFSSCEAVVCAGNCGKKYALLSKGTLRNIRDIVKKHDSLHPECDRKQLKDAAKKEYPAPTFSEVDYALTFNNQGLSLAFRPWFK